MTTTKTIEQVNRELGDQVLAEIARNPKAYVGKYVGIADGKVVIATDDLDELVRRLDEVEPDPRKVFCLNLECDYHKVYEILGIQ